MNIWKKEIVSNEASVNSCLAQCGNSFKIGFKYKIVFCILRIYCFCVIFPAYMFIKHCTSTYMEDFFWGSGLLILKSGKFNDIQSLKNYYEIKCTLSC